MSTDNKTDIKDIVKNLSTHFETRLEYAKLILVEKSAVVLSRVISFGIIAAMGFIFILMFSIAAGIWFGEYLGAMYKGFIAVSGIYFILILILLAFRKRLFEKKFIDVFISISLKEQQDEEE